MAGLSGSDLDRYEDILNLETVDIFNFITGNAEPPAFVDTPMMARLQVCVCVWVCVYELLVLRDKVVFRMLACVHARERRKIDQTFAWTAGGRAAATFAITAGA